MSFGDYGIPVWNCAICGKRDIEDWAYKITSHEHTKTYMNESFNRRNA